MDNKGEQPIYEVLNAVADEVEKAGTRGVNGVEEWAEAREVDIVEFLMFSKDLALVTADNIAGGDSASEATSGNMRTAFQVGYEFAARKYAKEM